MTLTEDLHIISIKKTEQMTSDFQKNHLLQHHHNVSMCQYAFENFVENWKVKNWKLWKHYKRWQNIYPSRTRCATARPQVQKPPESQTGNGTFYHLRDIQENVIINSYLMELQMHSFWRKPLLTLNATREAPICSLGCIILEIGPSTNLHLSRSWGNPDRTHCEHMWQTHNQNSTKVRWYPTWNWTTS